MRAFTISLLAIALMASVASAELLTTANPIGQGKWAVEGFGMKNQDFLKNAMAGLDLTAFGAYAGYGITDKASLYLNAASGNVGGLPAGTTASVMAYGLNLMYTVIEEGASLPVSVAVGAGYRTTTMKVTNQADTDGAEMMVGVGVSKMIVPFVPYGAVAYRKATSKGADSSTQLDVTLGSAIAWSEQGAVFAEYTLQSITPAAAGSAVYSSGQMALGVGYKI